MNDKLLEKGDALLIDQQYADWHGQYHNPESGLRLHSGQQTRPPVVGEKLTINYFWVAEAYPIELCSDDGSIFRVSYRDAMRMVKAELVSRGAVFYGDAMMKPPKDTPTCDYCEVNPRMDGSKYCRQCNSDIVDFFSRTGDGL